MGASGEEDGYGCEADAAGAACGMGSSFREREIHGCQEWEGGRYLPVKTTTLSFRVEKEDSLGMNSFEDMEDFFNVDSDLFDDTIG